MQFRKSITVEDNNKKMNIANFINIYTTIYTYTYVICDENMTQNKNDSINSILKHGRVVGKDCCVVFPTSGFPYLILCTKQCKWRLPMTYLARSAKNSLKYLSMKISHKVLS